MPRPPLSLTALVAMTTLVACTTARAQSGSSLGDESPALTALRESEATNAGAATSTDDGAASLRTPEIVTRITPTLAEALRRYRSDARAQRTMRGWYRDSGRYRARIEGWLRAEGVPADLLWVAAAESGFNPRSESSAGAGGIWQLMPETARHYGLRVDAWLDERRDPEKATRAAARMLRDLRARFGAWDLALAAYNMGYGALLRAMRRHNTNDFESLARAEGALPYETLRYVPRILALSVAAANAQSFGLDTVQSEQPIAFEDATLSRSVPVDALARALAVEASALRVLNPSLLTARLPPSVDARTPHTLHVPVGCAARMEAALASMPAVAVRSYRMLHGESAGEIAARYGLTASQLLALSGLHAEHRVVAGTELIVPDRAPVAVADAARPVVLVRPVTSPPSGRRRVFYRVGVGDSLNEIARALDISRDELTLWNALDPAARLPSGLWLQAYVSRDPSAARVRSESEVDTVARSSDEASARLASEDGRVRRVITVREGDTMASLAARYGLTTGGLARINHRPRNATLIAGESLVVWVPFAHAEADPSDNSQPEVTPAATATVAAAAAQ